MQQMWVRSLGREDTLEEEMATHFNIVAQKITWTEEPGGCSPWGCRELDTIEQPSKHDINMQERNSTMNE